MKREAEAQNPAARPALQETRYSLRDLLEDVAEERTTGALGAEKLRQADIHKVFDAESRAHRRPGS